MRKSRATGKPPGRPLAEVKRRAASWYVEELLIEMNRSHALETGVTESSIVEGLLRDKYRTFDGEAVV